jgi:gliding motility-associated-like protein
LTTTPAFASYLWSTGETTASINVHPVLSTTYWVTGTDVNGCRATDSVVVTVHPLPVALVQQAPTGAVCEGDTVLLTVTPAFASYLWSTGETTASISVYPALSTTYWATGTDVNGCQATDSVAVTVHPLPTVLAQQAPTGALCEGESVTLTASGALNYTWTPGGSGASITVTPTATTGYLVTGIDANGCEDTATIIIAVHPLPVVNITGDTDICVGQQTPLAATGALTYLWNTGETASAISPQPSVTTSYWVTGTDPNGCSNSDTITVSVHALPIVDAGQDVHICDGDAVTLTASGASTYLWTPGGSGQSIIVAPSTTATYSVLGTDTWGCEDDDDVTVIVFALPSVSAIPSIICPGEPALLTATPHQAGLTYTWQPGNMTGDSLIVTPISTMTYTVTGIDANGCQDTSIATVTVRNDCPEPDPVLEIPTAFSPNGDGLNDLFRIEHTENFTLTSIRVFNRWGQLVFETADRSNGWDGTHEGREQGMGAFAVMVTGMDDKGGAVVFKGNLTLLR